MDCEHRHLRTEFVTWTRCCPGNLREDRGQPKAKERQNEQQETGRECNHASSGAKFGTLECRDDSRGAERTFGPAVLVLGIRNAGSWCSVIHATDRTDLGAGCSGCTAVWTVSRHLFSVGRSHGLARSTLAQVTAVASAELILLSSGSSYMPPGNQYRFGCGAQVGAEAARHVLEHGSGADGMSAPGDKEARRCVSMCDAKPGCPLSYDQLLCSGSWRRWEHSYPRRLQPTRATGATRSNGMPGIPGLRLWL